MTLDSLAHHICNQILWAQSEVEREELCSEQLLDVKVTRLLGRPRDMGRKHFSNRTIVQEALDQSRFLTFELNVALTLSDEEIDIQQ